MVRRVFTGGVPGDAFLEPLSWLLTCASPSELAACSWNRSHAGHLAPLHGGLSNNSPVSSCIRQHLCQAHNQRAPNFVGPLPCLRPTRIRTNATHFGRG